MKRFGLCTCVFLEIAFLGITLYAMEEPMPEIWKQIEQEAKSITKDKITTDAKALSSRIEVTVKHIATQYDRTAIEKMIYNSEILNHISDPTVQRLVNQISAQVIVQIANPKNEHTLIDIRQVDIGYIAGVSWYGVAVTAIDLYHDNRSRDLLLALAIKDEKHEWIQTDEGYASFTSPFVHALGFLRSYNPEDIKPKIESTLLAEDKNEKPKLPTNAVYSTKADYLRALLASWKYAAELNPAERDQYRDFERRLWRSWALAHGWGDRRKGVPFMSAAGLFAKSWKDGDERFVLRIFEEPNSTIDETNIAEHLAYRFLPDGKKKLQKIADSNSPKASAARRALEEAKRIKTLKTEN
jgi:hypothetical protein